MHGESTRIHLPPPPPHTHTHTWMDAHTCMDAHTHMDTQGHTHGACKNSCMMPTQGNLPMLSPHSSPVPMWSSWSNWSSGTQEREPSTSLTISSPPAKPPQMGPWFSSPMKTGLSHDSIIVLHSQSMYISTLGLDQWV